MLYLLKDSGLHWTTRGYNPQHFNLYNHYTAVQSLNCVWMFWDVSIFTANLFFLTSAPLSPKIKKKNPSGKETSDWQWKCQVTICTVSQNVIYTLMSICKSSYKTNFWNFGLAVSELHIIAILKYAPWYWRNIWTPHYTHSLLDS